MGGVSPSNGCPHSPVCLMASISSFVLLLAYNIVFPIQSTVNAQWGSNHVVFGGGMRKKGEGRERLTLPPGVVRAEVMHPEAALRESITAPMKQTLEVCY